MQTSDFKHRPDCPACGTQGRNIFQREFREPRLRVALCAFYAEVGALDYSRLNGAVYSVARCPGCGTLFQTEVPSDDLLGTLYEVWIDPGKARRRFHDDPPLHRNLDIAREVNVAFSLMLAGAPRTSLDYGCGWGAWGRMARSFGFEAWGTELSGSRRDHALGLGIQVVPEAELPDGYFGHINLDQVLEHVPQPRDCLMTLASKLHPAGSLRLAVPHAGRVPHALRNFDREISRPRLGAINAIAPLEHLNAFSTAGLVRLGFDCGLVRVLPPWADLLRCLVFPPGLRGKIATLLRPAYLRSRFTTSLYFQRKSRQP